MDSSLYATIPFTKTARTGSKAQFSFTILPEKSLILLRLDGSFSLEDLFAATMAVWADPNYSESFRGILDLTRTSLHISVSDLHALTRFLREDKKTSLGRWASVVTSPVATAFVFLYKKALAPRQNMEAFSTVEAACDFLKTDRIPILEWFRNAPRV
ncbi:MAG: hypothetical protein ABI615_12785 [Chthoniobacterales bacterium]